MGWALAIDKADIARAKLVDTPTQPLGDGQVRLTVKRFALTANNVTYAAFGDVMGYWAFFPGADGTGRLPVWGFAQIDESRCPDLQVGERIYGYVPAASELVVTPGQVTAGAFIDETPHRAGLPAAYNRYVRCAGDQGYDPAMEAEQMVLQPLFLTSFLLDRHIRNEAAFGAQRILLTSASSKTAIALAHLLARTPMAGVTVEALTSAGGRAFVEGLGLYDAVHTYDAITDIPADSPAMIVDFAGDSQVVTALHTHLGERLKANIRVGGAHWENSAPAKNLPGPAPSFFFAPSHLETLIQDVGPRGFQNAHSGAWSDFARGAKDWLNFQSKSGSHSALTIYDSLVRGDAIARDGLVIEL
tara:strand:- start:158 stop:1234 length:1077 start_codon:yes stop_codon:yes gene_type:complete